MSDNQFSLTGPIASIYDTEQVSEKFAKRDFVVEISDDKYPQFAKFQLVQDRCDILDQFSQGQEVKVYFDIRGRKWQDKYFTNLQAWKIEAVGAHAATSSQSPETATQTEAKLTPAGKDDLPF